MFVDLVANLNVGVCQRVKCSGIDRSQVGVNVVPQNGESSTPEADQLIEFGLESTQVLSGGVGHVQAGRNAVVKDDVILLTSVDENLEVLKLVCRVLLPP